MCVCANYVITKFLYLRTSKWHEPDLQYHMFTVGVPSISQIHLLKKEKENYVHFFFLFTAKLDTITAAATEPITPLFLIY